MIQVNVSGGELLPGEKEAYIARASEKYPGRALEGIDLELDGEFVNISYRFSPQKFSRIRRITGYLVGDMNQWNDAKSAEEADRVTHI